MLTRLEELVMQNHAGYLGEVRKEVGYRDASASKNNCHKSFTINMWVQVGRPVDPQASSQDEENGYVSGHISSGSITSKN